MKTISELLQWCEGAELEFGDPAIPVGQMFVRFQQTAGRCRICLCTEQRACIPQCSWVDATHTVCSACVAPAEPLIIRESDEIVVGFNGSCLFLNLLGETIPLPVNVDEALIEEGVLKAFGIREVTPGVWFLTPSLNMPDVLHMFVVVYDVPTPAPWERLIIIPGESR